MSTPKLAIPILCLLITSIYLYQTLYVSHKGFNQLSNTGSSRVTMAENAHLSNLAISLRQTSSDPITLAISVKNNNSNPVTILTWDSPLDPLALQLGVLSITPVGSSTPLDIPEIKVARKMPPGKDALVELGAGETSPDNVVELKEMMVGKQLRDMQVERVSVKCKGEWRAVWAAKRQELDTETIESMGTDEKARSGEFQSEEFEVVVR